MQAFWGAEQRAGGALGSGCPGRRWWRRRVGSPRRPDGTSKGFSPDKEWEANAWVFAPDILEGGGAGASGEEVPDVTAAPSGAAGGPAESAAAEAASSGVGEQSQGQAPAPAIPAVEEVPAPGVGDPWDSDPEEQWVPDAFGSLGPSSCAGAVFCSIA